MRISTLTLSLTLLCGALHAYARETYRLVAPVAVRPLLQTNLPQANETAVAEDDAAAKLGLIRRLRQQIPELLGTVGYFTPVIDIDPASEPLVVNVDPGPQSHVSEVRIEFRGPLGSDEAFRDRAKELRGSWGLPTGVAFNQRDWTTSKDHLLQAVASRDFPAAKLIDTVADVDDKSAEVHLNVVIESGPPYTLGALQIEGLADYDKDLIDRYNPLKEGEPYNLDRLLTLQSALQNTPYFSAVDVDVDLESGKTERVPVRVRVSEAKPRRAGVGLGYSSNTGYRAELTYRDANWLGRAWQLSAGTRIEQLRQAAFADVFLPPAPEGHRNSFGGLVESSDIKGLRTSRQAIGVARTKPRGNIETRIGLSFQREKSEPDGAELVRKQALALNWSWTQRRVDNVLEPRSGYVLNVQFGGASKALLSDANFVRSYGRLLTYWPVFQRDVLTVRAEGGYTAAKSRKFVPEDFLFRTGGAQSVRGYSYLGIGVREGDATVGGRYMTTGSVEYTHWTTGKWGYAGFVDAGNATDQLEAFRVKFGVGVGVRWKSPAGPLAFDLAYGIDDRRIRPHISIAIAF